jgi:hypothetical protein
MLTCANFAENAAGGTLANKLGYWRPGASQIEDNLLELRRVSRASHLPRRPVPPFPPTAKDSIRQRVTSIFGPLQ